MTDELYKYQKLKNSVESAQRQAHRASGVVDDLKRKLKEKHGFSSTKEAKKHVAEMEKRGEELEEEIGRQVKRFEKKWKNELARVQKND